VRCNGGSSVGLPCSADRMPPSGYPGLDRVSLSLAQVRAHLAGEPALGRFPGLGCGDQTHADLNAAVTSFGPVGPGGLSLRRVETEPCPRLPPPPGAAIVGTHKVRVLTSAKEAPSR